MYKNRKQFRKVLKAILDDLNLKNSLFKAVLMGLSERDETADICMKRGKIEPDTDLRDYERIPLSKKVADYQQNTKDHVKSERENIERYFEEEVKPHVHSAWVDYAYTRVGYEIPFTRYFYEFEELESSEKIKQEIEDIEKDIKSLMNSVLGDNTYN